MGGHAGGDVASAIATQRITEADVDYDSAPDAAASLEGALIAANRQLAETVAEHSELTGMGTTVSALLLQGDRVVISHIGDSRIYLLRSASSVRSPPTTPSCSDSSTPAASPPRRRWCIRAVRC